MTQGVQTSLFEAKKTRLANIKISLIAPWQSTRKGHTTKAITSLGFNSSILVVERKTGNYKYKLVDGQGRLDDAVMLNLISIPANILPASTTDLELAAHRASRNLNRRNNPILEAKALAEIVDALTDEGLAHEEALKAISDLQGIGIPTQRRLLKLIQIPAWAQTAVADNTLSVSTANQLLELRQEQVEELEALHVMNGKLTAADLKTVRTANRHEEITKLPPTLFAKAPAKERFHNFISNLLNEGVTITDIHQWLDYYQEKVAA
jgi:ParB-like chromosome segregation protein Spo0J